jgi:hypothetical protein
MDIFSDEIETFVAPIIAGSTFKIVGQNGEIMV